MPTKSEGLEWIWNPLQNASIPERPVTVRNFLGNRREDISATVAGDNAGCELLQILHNSSQNGASRGLGIPYISRRQTRAPVHAHPLNRLFPMVRAQMRVLQRRLER
jgi:hypothetical protein